MPARYTPALEASGGLEQQTATEIRSFLSGLDWLGEKVGAGVKEDTEDMEDMDIMENMEDMEDMEDTEDT